MAIEQFWLTGGLVVDGTGSEPYLADIAVRDRVITEVRRGEPGAPDGGPTVDCTGLIVTPGFIDIHTHSDVSFLADPLAASKLVQGVTTEVIGNCGFSAFPIDPGRRVELEGFLRGIGGPAVRTHWTDLAGYAAQLTEQQPVMNVAPLVGHGALRIAAFGSADVPVASAELARLRTLLRDALDQGAFGLSTGLTYVPSGFADPREIHELARCLTEYDALYATHARDTGETDALDEAIGVGRRSGVRVQFSHVALNDPRRWGQAGRLTDRFEAAADDGVDIRYDVYPYDASASSLTQYLPGWVQADGEARMQERLADPAERRAARDELAQGLSGRIPWDWSRVVISLAGPGDEEVEGRSVAEVAAERATSGEELCLDICARHGNTAQVILFYRDDADVREFLAHPLSILGSDGSAMPVSAPGRPHPRSFGAHVRLLERYVGQLGVLALADAVHKSTGAPARRLGITDRGRIAVGARADLVALDLAGYHETATWTEPRRLATGARFVWVNGVLAVADGALTGARAGQVLRRPA